MSKASILGRLKMTNKPVKVNTDPIIARREKLLARLQEQREMAQCFIDGKQYVATWEKIIVDSETGERKIQTTPRRIKSWFSGTTDKMLLEVRYGNTVIEFSDGQNAIEVGAATKLIPTIDTVIEAVSAGEIDEILKGFDKPRKA